MADPYDVIRDEFDREVRIDYLTNSTHEITTGGFGGNQLKWTVNWITIEPSGFLYFCGDPGTCIFSPLLTVVDSIVIPSTPAGRSYQFEYQTPAMGGHGELTKITLPSDAAATYKYEKHDMFTMGGQLSRGSVDTLRNRIIQKDLTYTEIHDAVPTARADTWSYSYDKTAPEFSTTITNPDGGNVQQFFIDPDNATNPLTGSVYKVVQPNGDTIERYWERNLPSGVASTHVNPGNPYVRAEYLTVAGASPKTNAKLFTHNQNGNLTQVAEYDWGVTVPRDPQNNNIPNGVPSGTPVRTTTNSYFASTPNASNVTTPSLAEAFAYWNPDNSATLLNAVNITEGRQGGAIGSVKAKTAFIYDNAQTTGNVTKKTDGVGSTIDTEMTYTASGNVKTVTDPNNSVTEFTYGSMCTGSDLYPTQRKDANGTSLVRTFTFTYDCDTGLKDFETDLDNVVTTDFDYDDFGRPTETVAFSNDASGTLKRKTTTEYNDSNRTVRVRSDLDGFGDGKLVAVAHFDQLGRQRLLRTTDGTIIPATPDTSGIKVQTRHLVSGSNTYQLASNPFRATTSLNASGEGAMGWTRTKFDQNGRVDEVETFAPPVTPAGTIADLPAPWGSNTSSTGKLTTNYNADQTTVTDQAGKVRRSTTDGLGRLKIVDEDPNGLDYTTNYTYDVLDNLTNVSQDAQSRTFVYNSLSRLTSATNPESGTITFTYDNNGNLEERTDARSTKATHLYDALNRLTRTTYSAGTAVATPTVNRCYDGKTWNGAFCSGFRTVPNYGRITHVDSSVSESAFAYDKLGRVSSSSQETDGPTHNFTYTYKRNDALANQTYPSGLTVGYAYDDAGRLEQITDGTKNYGSNVTYFPHGAIDTMRLGNGYDEKAMYNSRLQPSYMWLGCGGVSGCPGDPWKIELLYQFTGGDNNGNVRFQTLLMFPQGASALPPALRQQYDYDGVNRLEEIEEIRFDWPSGANPQTLWSRTYNYDPYGNRGAQGEGVGMMTPDCADAGASGCSSSDFNPINNRLSSTFAAYDLAGNQTQIKYPGQSAMDATVSYDANNMQVEFCANTTTACKDVGTNAKTTYHYDGNGNRVKKVVKNAGSTVSVYDAFGKLAAEYSNLGQLGQQGKTQYRTTDHLGSTRIVTNENSDVVLRRDFFPFGEEMPASATFGNRHLITDGQADTTYNDPSLYNQQFTGKERDGESELDYFGARYHAAVLGRFTSPDAPFADQFPENPQSWNLYVYGRNNPLSPHFQFDV